MKTFGILTLLIIFYIPKSYSQTFRAAFDACDNSIDYNYGQGTSFHCNAVKDICANVPEPGAEAHSYLIMYRATKDTRYLDKAIIFAKRVQERRDDNILLIYQGNQNSVANPTICSSPLLDGTRVPDNTNTWEYNSTINHTISKGWSYDEGPDDNNNVVCCNSWNPTPLYMGKIMFPMAELVYMIKVEFANDIQNNALPEEANGVNKYINQYSATYDISENVSSMDTYLDFANWLEIRLRATYDFLESDYWESGTTGLCDYDNSIAFGGYSAIVPHPLTTDATSIAQINQQCAIGKTLAYMYLYTNSTSTYKAAFQDHVINIARNLWCHLNRINPDESYPSLPNNLYQASEGYWSWCGDYNCGCYVGSDNPGPCTTRWEDVGHGLEEAQFLELCYRYNITFLNSSTPLFSNTTMKKMANTFAYIICRNPNDFSGNVAGGQGSDNWMAAHWGFLIPYNPYIYQELSDFVSSYALYNPLTSGSSPGQIQTSYLALAQSPYSYSNSDPFYSNANALTGSNFKFNPIAVRRGHSLGVSNVYNLASGDFDNNGLTDFVSVDNGNGIFYSYTPDIYYNPNSLANCWLVAQSNSHGLGNWKGVAGGDFNSSHPGDELMALNFLDEEIYYFEQNGGTLSEQNLSPTVSHSWAGMTSGDFDGIVGEEAIAITTNGDVYLIKYNNGLQQPVFISNIGISQPIGITSGNFDQNVPFPQIAVIDNTSGKNLTIYKLENGILVQIHQYTTAGSGNYWNSITSGDLDGDGQVEITAHRDVDGQMIIYKVKNGAITPVYGEFFPIDQQIRAITTGRFKSAPDKDALVVFRNYEGQITIFSLDGQCPGLYLNDVTIDDNYTINNSFTNTNNNYPIDYHVSNTLFASSFKVEDGNTVNFIAGKKIVVKPGVNGSKVTSGSIFHAYIDPNLSCNNSVLRINNPGSYNNNEVTNISPKQDLPKGKVGIAPNPTQGLFKLNIIDPENNGNSENYKVFVYNLFGGLLFQKEINNITTDIDLTGNTRGMYFVKVQKGTKIWTDKEMVE